MNNIQQPRNVVQTAAQEDVAKKTREALIEIQSRAFDKAAAYTNLITLGGYAGSFAIWNFTRAQMSPRGMAAIAILLSVSLATFVFFEVYKMVVTTKNALRQRKILIAALPPEELLRKLAELQRAVDRTSLTRMLPIWAGTVSVCVLTALIALTLLFYTFLATLLGLPIWP